MSDTTTAGSGFTATFALVLIALMVLSIIATVAVGLVVVLLLIGNRLGTAVAVSVILALILVIALVVDHAGCRAENLNGKIKTAATQNAGTIVVGLVPTLLVILGLVVRGSYSAFYRQLKVLPEEVGFDASTLLQLSGALLFLMAVGYLLLLVWFTGIAATCWYWRRKSLNAYPGILSLALVSISALALTVVGTLHLRSEASDVAGEALKGCVVSPIEPLGMTLVGIRAQPVNVYWNGPAPAGFQLKDGPILYLGQANGTVVLYEQHSGHVARVPAASVVTKSTNAASRC